MCRFVAYIGTPIVIDELLVKPENSLVNQSYDAEEMSQPLNGDGFGLGWYARNIRRHPGLFRAITPAWNNPNLLYNASLIRTDCFFAHIRAASEGEVALANCHPFHYEEYLMMHNGGIEGFRQVKRPLVELLDEDIYLWIKGQTDSEHIFALLMQNARRHFQNKKPAELTGAEVAACFQDTFGQIETLKRNRGLTGLSAYNLMVTDGERIFGTRYSTRPDIVTPTLYYATGQCFQYDHGKSRMTRTGCAGQKAVLIVSEKLTDFEDEWTPIPPNHFIFVSSGLDVELIPMNV